MDKNEEVNGSAVHRNRDARLRISDQMHDNCPESATGREILIARGCPARVTTAGIVVCNL